MTIIVFLQGCGRADGPSGEVLNEQSEERPVRSETPQVAKTGAPEQSPLQSPRFREVQHELGIDQTYANGAAGEELMVESTGGGAGWLDYDRDGAVDLYLNQGGNPKTIGQQSNPSDQLFRNWRGRVFRNVTVAAGIHEPRYSQGVAAGDLDNDGFSDIYVTNVGENSLFQNQGDGTFLEISGTAGVDDPRWSSSAAWADLDLDGDLDLYVCNYLQFDPDTPVLCRHSNGEPGMCDPHQLEAWPDECFLNLGNGRFQASATQLGLFGKGNKALGVAVADFNEDHRPDIYVCNDTTDNFLFLQQENFTFIESAQKLGCAVSGYGEAQASMGVTVSDFNRDGLPDLYLTNFTREANTLYQNLGPAGFSDVTSLLGLRGPTLHFLGFGVVMADFDFNGQDDVFVANGHIDDWSPRGEDFEQTPLLLTFDGRRWHDVGAPGGEIFRQRFIGRAVAVGDYDSDGDSDIACVRQNQPALILRNEETHGEWLRFRFIGRSNNRNGIGVKVTVTSEGGNPLVQQLCGGTSYCATHEPVLTFGVGNIPLTAEIRWPNGIIQTLRDLSPNQEVLVLESGNPSL
ncbi:MAG: CRTAC1 family protein [Fuerstia sp.]|nr:CRTAC1 family protein [Fuerstiella sp.]